MIVDDLIDIEQIKNVRQAYSAHFDTHNVEALAALFTEDAVCEFGGGYGTWVGRDEIRNNYVKALADIGEPFDAIHIVTNPWITLVDRINAHGRWYLLDLLTRQWPQTNLTTRGRHDNPLLFLGIYEDDYRKIDGQWLIAYTKLHFLWPARTYTALRHTN